MTTTYTLQPRPGTVQGGWAFNEALLKFNTVNNPQGLDQVMFNGLGITSTWTNLSKS